MTDKERLEEIKERVLVDRVYHKYLDGTEGHWGKTYTLDEEDYKYLYEQAERVQVLEKKIENVMDRHTYLEGDYYNLQEQNKRYKQFIEHFAYCDEDYEGMLRLQNEAKKLTDSTDDTWLAHKMSKVSRQALEGENETD